MSETTPAAGLALVDEPIPMVCFLDDLVRLLRISLPQIHDLRKAGVFPLREITPPLDRRPRWYGDTVRAYLQGESRPPLRKPWVAKRETR